MSRLTPFSPDRNLFSSRSPIQSPSTDPFCGRSLVADADNSASLRQRYNGLAATEKLKDDLIKVH